MKTIVKTILALLLSLALMLPMAVMAEEEEPPITVMVNGEEVEFRDQPPVIVNGRTLLPIRFVFEKMFKDDGAQVLWEPTQSTVSLWHGDVGVAMQIGNSLMTVKKEGETNPEVQSMDATPIIMNGRTLLPARFVAEAFGADVFWEGETKTVSIIVSKENRIIEETKEADKEPIQIVKAGDKYGCIVKEQNIVLPIQYDEIDFGEFHSFNNPEYAMAKVVDSGKTSYVACYRDNETSLWKQKDVFEDAEPITMNGKPYACVQQNKKWGIIDHVGNSVVPIQYDEKPAVTETHGNSMIRVKENPYYGIYVFKNGEAEAKYQVEAKEYTSIGYNPSDDGNAKFQYKEGYIAAQKKDDNKIFAVYLNEKGEELKTDDENNIRFTAVYYVNPDGTAKVLLAQKEISFAEQNETISISNGLQAQITINEGKIVNIEFDDSNSIMHYTVTLKAGKITVQKSEIEKKKE